jgi:hypothetical protein
MGIPLLHQTDLFHPHEDPDDHWDLACVFALAHSGRLDLQGVLIDHPPPRHAGTPDVMGLAQLNHLTGLAVPCAVGSSVPVRVRGQRPDELPAGDRNGVRFVLRVLEHAREPVVITIVGSCRDVALAGTAAPGLFREKCRAVYLNAGSGTPRPEFLGELEYNVKLNPAAFAGIFDLPCPVYWMPCFELTPPRWEVEEFGTFYRFTQEEILPHLRPRMQAYFAYMLSRTPSADWLGALNTPPDAAALAAFGALPRNMWCTAGFLHATGQAVTREGEIVAAGTADDDAPYSFDPIDAACGDDGIVRWRPAADPNPHVPRFIFHVRDKTSYAAAMARAMRTLLTTLA